ncbi:metallophosphoesterase [Actinomyces gerencseriae]|uniref:metallophosphoesterase n=1 Tax=Actinomyces gerencseriae TaxID=52769 RepID=UPI00047E02D2|nr:metallophosphoesterase [Actinomyces gerencseriae]
MFPSRKLLAVSDLHVAYPENQQLLESMEPTTEDDWLIVAGDVAEDFSQVEKSLLYCLLDSQR